MFNIFKKRLQQACNFIKNEALWYKCFPVNFCGTFQNTFSSKTLLVAASDLKTKHVLSIYAIQWKRFKECFRVCALMYDFKKDDLRAYFLLRLQSRRKWWCWSKKEQELAPIHYGRGKMIPKQARDSETVRQVLFLPRVTGPHFQSYSVKKTLIF